MVRSTIFSKNDLKVSNCRNCLTTCNDASYGRISIVKIQSV